MNNPNYLLLGTEVNIFNPEKQQFKDEEIWAGMRQLRYGGQIPVNIQQHTFLIMMLAETFYPQDYFLFDQCMCHDMHETYIGEIPTGFKHIIPGFGDMDERWSKAVYAHVCIPFPSEEQAKKIKVLDVLALILEMQIHEHQALYRIDLVIDKLYEHSTLHGADILYESAEELLKITADPEFYKFDGIHIYHFLKAKYELLIHKLTSKGFMLQKWPLPAEL